MTRSAPPRPASARKSPARPRKPDPAAAKTESAGSDGDRIAKVLSRAGVTSRRDAERMIAEGRVAVNGKVIDSPALNVTAKDRITVDGHVIGPPEPPRLWLYHKPEGLVSTARDEQGRATVFDHLPEGLPRVMTVGRLDLNSEGLLLLTNDGELKRKLELPSTGWLRKYRVRVNGRPEDSAFEPLRQGMVIDGEVFQPMTVTLDRQQGANAWLTVGLREGRNREIRRAMEAVGMAVNRLIRISYGPFQLGELKPGEVSEVRPRMLRDQLGLAETPMPTDPSRPKAAGKGAAAQPQRRAAAGEGGRLGPAGKPASHAAPAARGKPATARTTGKATAAPTARRGTGAKGLAASAEAWLDGQMRKTGPTTKRAASAPRPEGPVARGGLSRGGARPEAMAERPADKPARKAPPRAPEAKPARGGDGSGAAKPPRAPRSGGASTGRSGPSLPRGRGGAPKGGGPKR